MLDNVAFGVVVVGISAVLVIIDALLLRTNVLVARMYVLLVTGMLILDDVETVVFEAVEKTDAIDVLKVELKTCATMLELELKLERILELLEMLVLLDAGQDVAVEGGKTMAGTVVQADAALMRSAHFSATP